MAEETLKNCPFCGSPAEIQVVEEGNNFQIVGCTNIKSPYSSLLCPNPRILVFKDDKGNWDYRWWNRRSGVTP